MATNQNQWAFLQDVGKLIAFAAEKGYTLTLGEGLRTPAQAWLNSLPKDSILTATAPDGTILKYDKVVGGKGISKSFHLMSIAIDFNLIINGALAQNAEDYKELGDFWESLSPENRAGWKFVKPRPDGPHFERNTP